MAVTHIRYTQPEVVETEAEQVEVLPSVHFKPHGNWTTLLMSIVFNSLINIINIFLYLQLLCFHSTRCMISSKWLGCSESYWRKQQESQRSCLGDVAGLSNSNNDIGELHEFIERGWEGCYSCIWTRGYAYVDSYFPPLETQNSQVHEDLVEPPGPTKIRNVRDQNGDWGLVQGWT